VDNNYLMYHY